MFINAYGDKNNPLFLLLAPMMVSGEVLYSERQKEKMDHGNRGHGAPCRYSLRDHGRNSAIINIKKENANERLRSII